jgi:hypothetical protein
MNSLIGQTLGKYRILAEISPGGMTLMCSVWAARFFAELA